MPKEISIIDIEKSIFDLKGVERILTHLYEAEQFKNSNDLYMFLFLKNSIKNITSDLEMLISDEK